MFAFSLCSVYDLCSLMFLLPEKDFAVIKISFIYSSLINVFDGPHPGC